MNVEARQASTVVLDEKRLLRAEPREPRVVWTAAAAEVAQDNQARQTAA